MSSKPLKARSRIKPRQRDAILCVRAPTTIPPGVAKKGCRRPKAEDFQVTVELPQSPPILDRELSAIEISLGHELQDFLAGNPSEPSEKMAADRSSRQLLKSDPRNAPPPRCRVRSRCQLG